MMVTGTIVGAACFFAGWFCHMAWDRLYGKSYEDEEIAENGEE